ncbi:MAG: hypothetical protein AB1635_20280, partial [Acidobacteriota bacterium]
PGPQGAQGDAGPAGPAGQNGVSGWQLVEREWNLPSGNGMGIYADCPSGKQPTGGGWQTNTISGTAVHIAGSFPQYMEPHPYYGEMSRWLVSLNNPGPPTTMWVYAICVDAQ